jgi:hypothetical protein
LQSVLSLQEAGFLSPVVREGRMTPTLPTLLANAALRSAKNHPKATIAFISREFGGGESNGSSKKYPSQ